MVSYCCQCSCFKEPNLHELLDELYFKVRFDGHYSHPSQTGQSTVDELRSRDMRQELEEKERESRERRDKEKRSFTGRL